MAEPKPDNASTRPASIFRRLAQRLRGDTGAQQMLESLEEVIEESERENPSLTPRERTMLANLLKFGELRVGDLMVPRTDIVAAEESTSLSELLARFREAQHSRLPIYRETLDDPLGLVHIKDVVAMIAVLPDGTMRLPDIPITTLKRELLVAPPSMPARDLLVRMQTTHLHLALVIDEYGGTDGLISIEDLVEQIVGDIDDEHDVDESPNWRALPDGVFEADGRMPLEDFREHTGVVLEPPDPEAEVDTLGGLVVALMGRLPQRGEIVTDPSGYEFEILDADPRRIRRLRLKPPAKPAEEEPA
jgi:CBS domain containing-hemolysin-like protein